MTNGPNPRLANRLGQIVRRQKAGNGHAATTLSWDVFLVAGAARIWIHIDGTQPSGTNDRMLAADPTRLDGRGGRRSGAS